MFLSVAILGGFTTEAHAIAPLHQDRHAATSYTTSRDAILEEANDGFTAQRLRRRRRGYDEYRGDQRGAVHVHSHSRRAGFGDLVPALRVRYWRHFRCAAADSAAIQDGRSHDRDR